MIKLPFYTGLANQREKELRRKDREMFLYIPIK